MEKKYVPARYLQAKKTQEAKVTTNSKRTALPQTKDKENVTTNTKSLAEQLMERRLAKAAIKTAPTAKKSITREEPKSSVQKKFESKPKVAKPQKAIHSEDLTLILTARIYQHRVVRQKLEEKCNQYATERQVGPINQIVLEARKEKVQALQIQLNESRKLLETKKALEAQVAIMHDRLEFLRSIPILQVIAVIEDLKSQLQFQSKQMQLSGCYVSRDRLLASAERALQEAMKLNEEISLESLQQKLESRRILWENVNQEKAKIASDIGAMQDRIRKLYSDISHTLSE
jgi:sporulation protein YlmC with PRC-barrel domain